LRKNYPIRFLSVLFVCAACLIAAAPASKKKSTHKVASRKTGSKKKTAGRKSVPSWRNTQRTPSPERYKEIQQALASKGYLDSAAPTGVWDTSSVEALKKFQQDQSLQPSGKLDSLSLIALGLGPRHDQQPPPAP
jgi:peptidoglycan hydrolase-like protein with peptidoglycan-binding domain